MALVKKLQIKKAHPEDVPKLSRIVLKHKITNKPAQPELHNQVRIVHNFSYQYNFIIWKMLYDCKFLLIFAKNTITVILTRVFSGFVGTLWQISAGFSKRCALWGLIQITDYLFSFLVSKMDAAEI